MRTMARTSAQVSHSSHSTLLRVAERRMLGAEEGTEAGTAVATSGGLPMSIRIAVGAIGGMGRASGCPSAGRGWSATAARRGSGARCSWSSVTTSSKRRTRSSKDSALGGSGASSFGAGGPPSSARRARAASSSPLAEGREGGIGEMVSVSGIGGGGAGSVRDSLGGTAVFLRAARSVLVLGLLTLAWTPDP